MAKPSSAREFDIVTVLKCIYSHHIDRIHQPSAELFQMFDRLLLLKKGGQTVYFGDVGEGSSTMLEYFKSNGAPPCDPEANP